MQQVPVEYPHIDSPANRNTTLNIKRWTDQSHTKLKDTSKLFIGHFIALQRKEIQIHSSERHKFPQSGKLDKPLVQSQPQGGDFTKKRNHAPKPVEKGPQTQQSKQNESTEKYTTGEEI